MARLTVINETEDTQTVSSFGMSLPAFDWEEKNVEVIEIKRASDLNKLKIEGKISFNVCYTREEHRSVNVDT